MSIDTGINSKEKHKLHKYNRTRITVLQIHKAKQVIHIISVIETDVK